MYALTAVGPSAQARQAAALLRLTRHVHLTLGGNEPPPPHFLRAPAAVDLLSDTALVPEASTLERLDQLLDRGLSLELCDVASLGRERLVQELYHPLLVRHSYCLGTSSLPLNLDNFHQYAVDEALVVWAAWHDRPVAVWMLKAGRPPTAGQHSGPEFFERSPGLDFFAGATAGPFADWPDGFEFAALQILGQAGYHWIRHREAPWVTPRSLPRWWQRARSARGLAFVVGDDYLSWCPTRLAPGEGVLSFELTGRGLRPRRFGHCAAFQALEARLQGLGLVTEVEAYAS